MRQNFIIRLKRSYKRFIDEIELQEEGCHYEYARFLKALTFYAFIEQVITACVMYPKSKESSKQELEDLSYGMPSNLGIGRFHLRNKDYDNLARMVIEAGREVFENLDGVSYYRHRKTPLRRFEVEDEDYGTDITAVANVTKINNFTFCLEIVETDLFEILDENIFSTMHSYEHLGGYH